MPLKFEGFCLLTHTAWCPPTCLVRRWLGEERRVPEYGPTATAFLHQAVPFQRCFFKFQICRPQWAEARRMQDLVFGAAGRKCQILRRASPVNGGPGGDAYEHRRKPGVHRRKPPGAFLVPFWASKKEQGFPQTKNRSRFTPTAVLLLKRMITAHLPQN